MKLGEKQELFMRLLPRLIDKAHESGSEHGITTTTTSAPCRVFVRKLE